MQPKARQAGELSSISGPMTARFAANKRELWLAPLCMMNLEVLLIRIMALDPPLHHRHQVGSLGFLMEAYIRKNYLRGVCSMGKLKNIGSTNIIWHEKLLLSPCRLALLLGTFNGSDQFSMQQ